MDWLDTSPVSTEEKQTLLCMGKRGNKGLRVLFLYVARAVLDRPEKAVAIFGNWILELLSRKPFNVLVVVLANKLAHIAWSVLSTKKNIRS
jgi:transposase